MSEKQTEKMDKTWIFCETAGVIWRGSKPSYFVGTGQPGGQRFDNLDEAKAFAKTIAHEIEVVR